MVMVGYTVKEENWLTGSSENGGEIAFAKKIFMKFIEMGWFVIGEIGDKKMQLFSFDPDLSRITRSFF